MKQAQSVSPARLHEGLRLFNTGEFWHAHEQWEVCWLAAPADDALFYKGIIQAAAALVKWQEGNQRGLNLNWAKSKAKLDQLPAAVMGLDIAGFRDEMERFVIAAHAATSSIVPPQLHSVR